MKIPDWQYLRRDLGDYPAFIAAGDLSLPAAGANAAVHDLAGRLRAGDRVLEVGCGSYSFLLEHLPAGVHWEGIDVFEVDDRGRRSLATRLGSVHDIPFEAGSFDYVLANQSIEHWFEYGVSLEAGIREVARVLKAGGRFAVNFPLHLHGHPWFVTGDLNAILKLFDAGGWLVEEVAGYEDRSREAYRGWERCKFPYRYVAARRRVESSFTCAVTVRRTAPPPRAGRRENAGIPARRSALGRAWEHGLYVMLWKALRKVRSKWA